MTQIVTRVPEDLAQGVDDLVASGMVASRSAAVRLGLQHLVDHHRRQHIGSSIVEGYVRHPQTDAEVGWTDTATAEMIAEEPW